MDELIHLPTIYDRLEEIISLLIAIESNTRPKAVVSKKNTSLNKDDLFG
jgi:hypothetical protein